MPVVLVSRILSDVLALKFPAECEQKRTVESKRCLQVVEPLVMEDEYAEQAAAIQLPTVDPNSKHLVTVRAMEHSVGHGPCVCNCKVPEPHL